MHGKTYVVLYGTFFEVLDTNDAFVIRFPKEILQTIYGNTLVTIMEIELKLSDENLSDDDIKAKQGQLKRLKNGADLLKTKI